MSQLIEDLESTTFVGRRFTRKQITVIQQTVKALPGLSRRELGHTICEHLQWITPKGSHCIQACLTALEEMEKLGILTLPPKIDSKKRGPQKKIVWTDKTNEQAPICCSTCIPVTALHQWAGSKPRLEIIQISLHHGSPIN